MVLPHFGSHTLEVLRGVDVHSACDRIGAGIVLLDNPAPLFGETDSEILRPGQVWGLQQVKFDQMLASFGHLRTGPVEAKSSVSVATPSHYFSHSGITCRLRPRDAELDQRWVRQRAGLEPVVVVDAKLLGFLARLSNPSELDLEMELGSTMGRPIHLLEERLDSELRQTILH